MQSEHLKRCLATTRKSDKEETVAGEEKAEGNSRMGGPLESTEVSNWERVVDLF